MYETYNVEGERIDRLDFHTINIRNYGTLTADSGFIKRTLHGYKLQVGTDGLPVYFIYFVSQQLYI